MKSLLTRSFLFLGLLALLSNCNRKDPNIKFSAVNHVGITVKDLSQSIRFYEALTGVESIHLDRLAGDRLAKLLQMDGYDVRYATLYLDNLNIDLLEYKKPAPKAASYEATQISAMHLCFEVKDFGSAVARLKKIGVTLEGAEVKYLEEDGLQEGVGTEVISFKDPDGTHLQVMAPKGSFKRLKD